MKKNNTICLVLFLFTTMVTQAQRTAKIDLSKWKLTVPEGSSSGYSGKDLANYSENSEVSRFMFDDTSDKSLVFYAFPSVKSKNSYSRTELKEQNSFGNSIGWSFREGAKLKAVARMGNISKINDKYPRVIIVQMGSRLNDSQVNAIGAKDEDFPPFLKVYWDNGRIKLRSKKLSKSSITGNEVYREENWVDDDGFAFKENVDFEKFTLTISIAQDKMEVQLNNKETKTYSGLDYKKWSDFENFFRAGCYLQSKQVGDFANVKFYSLEVSH